MKFSVLIPAYKDKYLDECISSCLAQTYDDYEVIIVNDHSPNDIDAIVGKYSDPRIHYSKNDVGFGAEHIVSNWNHCLEYATGDYVMCIGDDDRLKSNCLEDYALLISQHPGLDVYHTRMEIIDDHSNVLTIQEERPETETVYSMIWHFWQGRRQVIGDWCFSTKALRENGGFVDLPYGWGSDNLTAFMCAISKGVANNRIPGFQYRESDVTLTRTHSPSATAGKIKAWKEMKRWYERFLNEVSVADDIDNIYKKNISELLDRHIDRKIEGEVEDGIRDYPYAVVQWMKTSKATGISLGFILKKIIKNLFH